MQTTPARNTACINPIPKVVITGTITGRNAAELSAGLSASSLRYLLLRVNSGGGCFNAGLACANAIATSSKTVCAIANGECASSALHLFLAAKVRLATPNTIFTLHYPKNYVYGAAGNPVKQKTDRALTLLATRLCLKQVARHTTYTVPQLLNLINASPDGCLTLNSQQALACGLIHRIVAV